MVETVEKSEQVHMWCDFGNYIAKPECMISFKIFYFDRLKRKNYLGGWNWKSMISKYISMSQTSTNTKFGLNFQHTFDMIFATNVLPFVHSKIQM